MRKSAIVSKKMCPSVRIPIVNQKEKKSYYGALDYRSKEFIIKGYDSANTKNTIDFLRYLQQRREGQKLAVIWDGASYHALVST